MSCVEQIEVLNCKEKVETSIRHCWVFKWGSVSFVRTTREQIMMGRGG